MNALQPSAVLDKQEIVRLRTPSNVRGAFAVLTDWSVILAALALCAWQSHALTILFALIVIGGRQLGLAILMHEASHRTLCASRRLNDLLGTWLCAAPVWTDLARYRTHHLAHHTRTGTKADPDLCLVTPFPTSRAGLLRKLLRDLSGLTGVKRIFAALAMDFDIITYTASGGARRIAVPAPGRWTRGFSRLAPVLVTNGMLGLGLWAAGGAWLYLVWAGAWLTTFSLFLRIRAIAEHACTERSADMLRNTRTTHANLLARVTVAPHRVNYHLAHHFLMTVPFFRLPELHALLKERGALAESQVASGYLSVLRRAVGARGDAPTLS